MFASVALAALLTAPESGLAVFEAGPAESRVPELYRLEADRFRYDLRTIRLTPGYTVEALTFPSPIVTAEPANNVVHAEYFRPLRPGKRPAVVVLHILGADFALSRYLSARLADDGVAALFVQLPYYGERRPPGSDARFLSSDIDRSMGAMRQGVCDVRRAIAWLAGREEVDAGALGVTGISLGGIVASIAAAVDPQIGRAAILLAGGGLAEILWEMPEAQARVYRRAWLDAGKTRADFEALTRPYDPLTYAEGLRGKDVLMFAGRADEIIPPKAAHRLWDAAGRPSIRWLDCGHYSAAGFLLPVFRETVAFFAVENPEAARGPLP